MDSEDFNGEAGRLIDRGSTFGREFIEYKYFLPNKLPNVEEIILKDVSLIDKANKANLALGELKGLAKSNLGTLQLFAQSSMRKEAVDSSKIEGTFVSLTDVFLSEAGNSKPEKINSDVKEVRNFVSSLNFAIKKLQEGEKIDSQLLNQMHEILLEKTRGHNKKVGEFRGQQNWIGNKNDVQEAHFVPPSEEHVQELINYLFNYMELSPKNFELLKIGLMHYYFETIHPYEDGNGRLGRTLILLYLLDLKIIENPLLYISPYFRKYKEDYYEKLMIVRKSGDYVSWLKFFLDGVRITAENTCFKLRKLIDLYEDYQKRLGKIKATPISYEILRYFFERPYWNIGLLKNQLGQKNYPLVRRGIDCLRKAEIISEYTPGKRNKFYVASGIFNIIEED